MKDVLRCASIFAKPEEGPVGLCTFVRGMRYNAPEFRRRDEVILELKGTTGFFFFSHQV